MAQTARGCLEEEIRAIVDILKNTSIPIIITMNDFANFRYRKGSNAATIINLCRKKITVLSQN